MAHVGWKGHLGFGGEIGWGRTAIARWMAWSIGTGKSCHVLLFRTVLYCCVVLDLLPSSVDCSLQEHPVLHPHSIIRAYMYSTGTITRD